MKIYELREISNDITYFHNVLILVGFFLFSHYSPKVNAYKSFCLQILGTTRKKQC